jgi:hypothetical protein
MISDVAMHKPCSGLSVLKAMTTIHQLEAEPHHVVGDFSTSSSICREMLRLQFAEGWQSRDHAGVSDRKLALNQVC